MGKILFILLSVVVIACFAALSMWGIPAPTATVEQIIPDAKLPH